ncbi:hypothetical protein CH373_07820 [Leptospira perolatii]|uniref:Uncharacterized protein n=1 Tax=Leptospira perolatii TaxID=2023191 RepID=A0A2M9ZPV6_9LEPT|nr:hypothetical protein CH360_04675 [Leptospira perolatii]PJZ74019.1 hypothetical protein CH373_07820 [Leptospira perolatii]
MIHPLEDWHGIAEASSGARAGKWVGWRWVYTQLRRSGGSGVVIRKFDNSTMDVELVVSSAIVRMCFAYKPDRI